MKSLKRIAALINATVFLGAASIALGQEVGEEYMLASDDRVEVTVFGLPDLSGQFRVSAGGTVALPLAGEVSAAGSTAAELAGRITERLRPLLSIRPNTTVSVVSRRPVYVLGGVAAPGAYEYEPRMRVLHVLARAGGLRSAPLRGEDTGLQRIGAEAELARDTAELQMLRVQRARLDAERDGTETLKVPSAGDAPLDAALLAQQQELLALRHTSLERAGTLLEEQKAEFRRELDALAAQAVSKREEVALLAELRANQERLLERGLVRRDSLVEYQRQILAAQAALNEIGAFEARARQSILRIDKEIADLRAARMEEVLSELHDNAQQLAVLRTEIVEAEKTLENLGGVAPAIGTATFEIQRETNGALTQIAVDSDARMRPGDILIVEMPRLSLILDFATDDSASQKP